MSGKILNVAVLGCGEIAQIAHLPILMVQDDRFKVVALCDISKQSVEHCGNRFKVPSDAWFYDLTSMLQSPIPIDLVLILTTDTYHAEHIIQTANAGKHILIEKPMAQTFAEADAIEEARKRNNVVIFVGYMRRFAPALGMLKERLIGKKIKYARVRDIIGYNKHFTSQAGMCLKYFKDFPPTASAEMSRRRLANVEEVLGRQGLTQRDAGSWMHLGGHGCHDMSAMREVFGMPTKCLFASRDKGDPDAPRTWSAVFDYEDFNVYFETVTDNVAIWDAHIEVYTDNARIKVQYDTPFIRGLPITITIQQNTETGGLSEETIRPTYLDPYSIEWEDAYEAIVNGKAYKTTPTDAKNDLVLIKMIMEALGE